MTQRSLEQLHRNRTFWVQTNIERPDHFSSHSKGLRRLHACVNESPRAELLRKNISMQLYQYHSSTQKWYGQL